MMQDINQAQFFINTLGGGAFDFRACHDKRNDLPAVPMRGTLESVWESLVYYNNQGYGIFATVNQMDGVGRELANVLSVRAHFVDLDNLNAMTNLQRAAEFYPTPSFYVQSSPNKAHVYWPVQSYRDNERFTVLQRKLNQFFDADKSIVDATRIMRLPGTLHQKSESVLVTMTPLGGYGYVNPVESLEQSLQHVNIIATTSERKELGDPELAAPSLDWLQYALDHCDPNDLDRADWISLTAAFKQAGWTLGDESKLFAMWSDWCARYGDNDTGENLKQWNSLRETQLGWKSIVNRVPSLKAYLNFGGQQHTAPTPEPSQPASTVPPMPTPPTGDCSDEILTEHEQKIWFKDCIFVEKFGEILTPSGRFMNATKFNGAFGGKLFIVNSRGVTTNEAWQAATRSTLWTVPKADHIRFLPHKQYLDMHTDELGRKGVNTYRPAIITRRAGDPSPFLNHVAKLLPVQSDQKYILDYLAHNAKYPGHKIPWAPLIQSAEGAGKGTFKAIMKHIIGGPYVYYPSANEMIESGSKFNAWMRAKLFIIVDEIRVDERRDMIEILKPFISEKEIEIQSKGKDQDKEDNYSNWMFFSNFKDAIPVGENSRRFSIFYSALQTVDQILQAGMDDDYFNNLAAWVENGGDEIVANYFFNYEIKRGEIPMRAPITSSTNEALRQSRGPYEQLIMNAIEDGLPGFKGGYVSTIAALNLIKSSGARTVTLKVIGTILESLGYFYLGRAPRAFMAEDPRQHTDVYNLDKRADVNNFGAFQGYE